MKEKGFAVYKSKYGNIKIEYDDDKITCLKKIYNNEAGKKTTLTDQVNNELLEYLGGKRKSFDFEYKLIGTEFQIKVWEALCDIPYGETRSYKEIAEAVDSPKAYRAVGMANNKNPITFAVPCHRVIGSNGELVGYAGGIEMKKSLLDMEKKNK
ncbi:MAG: methylated-DNA--[protein]-cysteine S-methyltransferase [Peptostreptococcaceae bacterium]|nr:methylated-DNA--[protein]-cysteine S-methyltransferase [Peptostreptococcaceae bacterium]